MGGSSQDAAEASSRPKPLDSDTPPPVCASAPTDLRGSGFTPSGGSGASHLSACPVEEKGSPVIEGALKPTSVPSSAVPPPSLPSRALIPPPSGRAKSSGARARGGQC